VGSAEKRGIVPEAYGAPRTAVAGGPAGTVDALDETSMRAPADDPCHHAPVPAPDDQGRLRVMTLVDYAEGGGAERVAVGLAEALDPARFAPMLCATRSRGGPVIEELSARMPVLRLSQGGRRRAWWALVRTLRRERVQVLHAHKFGSNVWGVVVGRLARVPVVIATEHTWSFQGQPVRRTLDRFLVGRLASAFVAVSEHDARKMVDVVGVPAAKVRVIRNGVMPRPRSAGASLRAELGIGEDAPVFGTACVLRPQKALDVMLAAFARVRERYPEATLLIAGAAVDERERHRLDAEVTRLGLGEAVRFLGRREDIDRVLAALDVFLISSDFEGMPVAMLEAMAAERAVVATAVGGVPEVAGADAAVVVPPRDPDRMAGEACRLLADPAERAALGRRARERVEREFTAAGSVRRWEDLYEELYGRTRRAAAASRTD
jgi:glycosyltransferase involved in cell wall biosynthesis